MGNAESAPAATAAGVEDVPSTAVATSGPTSTSTESQPSQQQQQQQPSTQSSTPKRLPPFPIESTPTQTDGKAVEQPQQQQQQQPPTRISNLPTPPPATTNTNTNTITTHQTNNNNNDQTQSNTVATPNISTSSTDVVVVGTVDPSQLSPAAPSGSPDPLLAPSSSSSSSSSAPNSVTRPVRFTGGPEGVGEAHLDLWYALVEWASDGLDNGVVLAWDSEEVGHRILALPTSTTLLDTLAQKQIERKRARIQALKARQAAEAAKARQRDMSQDAIIPIELQPLSTPPQADSDPSAAAPVKDDFIDTVPFHLASDLLQLDRPLAQLRHVWVPSRVSEDCFWSCYFRAAMSTIIDHVLGLQQPEDQLQDTNPAMGETTNIVIRLPDNTQRQVAISLQCTVGRLKISLAELTGIASTNQVLSYGGKILSDGASLASESVAPESTIDLFIQQRQ